MIRKSVVVAPTNLTFQPIIKIRLPLNYRALIFCWKFDKIFVFGTRNIVKRVTITIFLCALSLSPSLNTLYQFEFWDCKSNTNITSKFRDNPHTIEPQNNREGNKKTTLFSHNFFFVFYKFASFNQRSVFNFTCSGKRCMTNVECWINIYKIY